MKTLYFVATDTKQPNGVMHGARLSRPIARLSIMRRVLKRTRRGIPQAYGVGETLFR